MYTYKKLHGAIRTDPASEAKHLERSSVPNGRETPESESHRHTDADINTQTHIWRLTKQKPDGLTHT